MIEEIYSISNGSNRNLKMWTVNINPNHTPTYNHKHANFEISTVLNGSGKYQTEGYSFDMKQGDVFVFSSNEPHFISEIGMKGMKLLNLQFSPSFIGTKGFNFLSLSNANFCFSHSKDFKNRIPFENGKKIHSELLSILQEFEEKNEEYKLSIKTHLCNIILDLIRNQNYLSEKFELEKSTVKKFSKALSFIDNHFTEKITIKDLAGLTGMTENYFSTLFKKMYLITPSEYIISKRLELATEYILENSNLNILDIAVKCGFNNTANFNKLFKKYFGITPTKYKEYNGY